LTAESRERSSSLVGRNNGEEAERMQRTPMTQCSTRCHGADVKCGSVVLARCKRKKGSHGTPSSFESHTDDKASSGILDGLRSFLVPDQETCPRRGQDLKGRRGAPMPPRTVVMPWGQTIHTQGANYCGHRKSPKLFWCHHVIILLLFDTNTASQKDPKFYTNPPTHSWYLI
jgi:hypothetical protein